MAIRRQAHISLPYIKNGLSWKDKYTLRNSGFASWHDPHHGYVHERGAIFILSVPVVYPCLYKNTDGGFGRNVL